MRTTALLLLLAPLTASAAGKFTAKPAPPAAVPVFAPALHIPAVNAATMKALGALPSASVTPAALDILAANLIPAAETFKAPEARIASEISRAPVLGALRAFAERQTERHDAPGRASEAWQSGAQSFDGAAGGAAFVDPGLGRYRRIQYGSEASKVRAAIQLAAQGSPTFAALNQEFERRGGYYLLDTSPGADYFAAAAVDRSGTPVIILTDDLLNRDNLSGKWGDEYKGAPWEFIASVIAREQVFFNGWYSVIPASAEKLAISFMNMVKVFVELTNGTTRSWATDKDYKESAAAPQNRVIVWPWFEQLVHAARAAARGVGTNAGHLIDSKFLSWALWTGEHKKSGVPAFSYTLWEMLDGKYYRPNEAKNGQPLPPAAPRIDQATYDRASYAAYGADGKGSDQNNRLDVRTVFGWIIDWLRGRREL